MTMHEDGHMFIVALLKKKKKKPVQGSGQDGGVGRPPAHLLSQTWQNYNYSQSNY